MMEIFGLLGIALFGFLTWIFISSAVESGVYHAFKKFDEESK